MRKFASAMSVAAVLLGGSTAFAQEFGSKGDVAFSADRLFGIHGTHVDFEIPGPPDGERDTTSIGFGWQGYPASPYDIPRFAFDFFVIDHLSIGGSLAYASTSTEVNDAGDADGSMFLLSPRVGYAYMFSRVFGIWPRGGFTYHNTSGENDGYSGFGLTAECMFPISPTPHFAFLVGPTFDIDFSGEYEPDNGPDYDYKHRVFGLRVGLLGWL